MASSYHFIKQDALSPSLALDFTVNGAPYDVTGETVTFSMRPWNGTTLKVSDGSVTLDNPATSGVYEWQAGDTDTPGHFIGEAYLSPSGLTLPEDGYIHILI